jgi:hypothetical protein
MAHQDWTDSDLWKGLVERGPQCEDLRHYLKGWLDDVELLLAKGGTAPLNFTLHDDEHSFRVAKRMVELLPSETLARLSDFELALLLSAAYLHDIGMNPRREIVSQVRDFLLSGEPGNLNGQEARELQRWLDETHPGTQPPILVGKPVTERVQQAEFLTAYFCRHRHNDWSEHFIVEKAKEFKRHPYATWVQDLIVLCKSHHYGLARLMDGAFDLRIAGSDGKLVNLRYLAAVLRTADVLEFDPERTPQVILAHRSPGPDSKVYWYKDHQISLLLEKGSWLIFLTARTGDAWTHRAVQDTGDAVDRELETCATIERQNGFLRGKRLEGENYYRWPWPARLACMTEPLPDTFVPIDGAFRPNSERILALLAGTQLYHTPLAGVRELLQNAFDAVKEQIASELLQDSNPLDEGVRQARSQLHRVRLSVEDLNGELWLNCTDTGVGMTRRVIERYLLVSGSQSRPEVLELRRECAARGFKLERSGEFGIGVLSYFMLADQAVIETRSAPDTELDQESHGWRFETEGLDSVGELRPLAGLNRGTSLRLRIKDSMRGLILDTSFVEFIDRLIVKSPCVFEIRHPKRVRSFGPGWAYQRVDLLQRALDQRFPEGSVVDGISDPKKQKDAEVRKKELDEIRSIASSTMDLFGPIEQVLPNDIGSLRVHLPYFNLKDGPSLIFFKIIDDLIHPLRHENADEDQIELGKDGATIVRESWRGFSISTDPIDSDSPRYRGNEHRSIFSTDLPVIVELDIVDEATISIDRNSLVLDSGKDVREVVKEACLLLLKNFARHHKSSPYTEAAIALLRETEFELPADLMELSGNHWIFPANSKEDIFVWRPVAFPAVLNLDGPSRGDRLLNGPSGLGPSYRDEIRPFDFNSSAQIDPLGVLAPSRILLCKGRRKLRLALLCERGSGLPVDERLIAEFPEEWIRVIAIENDNEQTIYNRNSSLIRQAGRDAWQEFKALQFGERAGPERRPPDEWRAAVLSRVAQTNPEIASAFILYYCDRWGSEEWNSLKAANSESWLTTFNLAGLGSSRDFVGFWRLSDDNDGVLLRLSVDGATKLRGHVLPGGHMTLPIPNGRWWLDGANHDRGRSKKTGAKK